LIKYQGNGKIEEKTLNHIVFEMVQDMMNPVKNWLAFLFSDLNSDYGDKMLSRSKEEEKYSTYLCFMNLKEYDETKDVQTGLI